MDIIYFSPYSTIGFATGTIPLGVNDFTISGSVPQPARQFGFSLVNIWQKKRSLLVGIVKIYSDSIFERKSSAEVHVFNGFNFVASIDSINYWFLKKSINLYGEALLKTMA